MPNVGPYIYDVSISGFTRSSIYIYDISSLRVKYGLRHVKFGGWGGRGLKQGKKEKKGKGI